MNRKGFTLIELLIVVAIIAILAAIAVPNFLEAQTRSKVSRTKADMRSMATALEAYCIDYQHYPSPAHAQEAKLGKYLYAQYVYELTTPVSYLTQAKLLDPFFPDYYELKRRNWVLDPDFLGSYQYISYEGFWATAYVIPQGYMRGPIRGFCVSSYGPDRYPTGIEWLPVEGVALELGRIYDPTNGTNSVGDIGRFGGAIKKWSSAG